MSLFFLKYFKLLKKEFQVKLCSFLIASCLSSLMLIVLEIECRWDDDCHRGHGTSNSRIRTVLPPALAEIYSGNLSFPSHLIVCYHFSLLFRTSFRLLAWNSIDRSSEFTRSRTITTTIIIASSLRPLHCCSKPGKATMK